MPKKRIYTVTQVSREPTLLQKAVPFDVTLNGQVICTVVKPQGVWRECEKCGENTQNIVQFKNKKLEWEEITLCDKCSEELF